MVGHQRQSPVFITLKVDKKVAHTSFQAAGAKASQYNATNDSQSTSKSQLVAELGPAQPQLVFIITQFLLESHRS